MLHENEIPVDEAVVTSLLRCQRPDWASLPLSPAGAGSDNTMYRLGNDLLVRLPRTADKARSLNKERTWLPRLGPLVTCQIPEPVYAGTPAPEFPLPWSIYRWIDGTEVDTNVVQDWAAVGTELAMFVHELHDIDLMGASRTGELSWYRGGNLRDCDKSISIYFENCRTTTDHDLDVEPLEQLWRAAIRLPASSSPHVWLHGDLRPSNLLAAKGKLHAVIDFGCLSVGFPAAEHAPVWDLPEPARQAYWNAANLDHLTWAQARAWAIFVGIAGFSYYRNTWPAFATECRTRLERILTDDATR
ncbi:aminoglycoside phosphotransferase family protein [Micromonospora sp. 067-2]|uniref:aminoglycoside phosphotransferase family protein n=1 Tax=Micromonospora sp. 067-2 TaxID=2789270 RepID=UPI00397E8B6F